MAVTVDPATDWSQLYADVATRGNVPYASSETIDAAHATFQAMYVDLADVKARLVASGFDPPLVTIYADVLNVPAGTTWLLSDAVLFVAARRVQTSGPLAVNLDYRRGQTASLALFCIELDGRVTATAVPPEGSPQSFQIATPPTLGGVQVRWRDGTAAAVPVTWAQGMAITPSDTFQQALITEFIFATLLYDDHPEVALSQLLWLKSWSAESPALLSVFFRSASLLSLLSLQIDARENGATFVPFLTQDVYAGLATAFVAEAQQYEDDYRQLSTQKVVDDNFIALAKTLLANQVSQTQYVTKLLGQAKANYDNATAAVNAAQLTFNQAARKAELAKADFEQIGVPEWEREEIAKAIIQLGTAIITFGVGIAGMLAGDEAAGAASAGAAIDTAKAVEAAAEAGSQIAKLAQQLKEVFAQLKKLVEALKAVYEFTKGMVDAAGDIANAQSYAKKMKELDVGTSGAALTAGYQWEVYKLGADASIEDPIKKGIGYAEELKLAVDAVAIYGQALAAAQVAAISAGQQYAAVSWQMQLAQQQQQTLAAYVSSLEQGEAPTVAMMQGFYQRYVDAKSSLFAAVQSYRASYFYWALEPSHTNVAIIDDVADLDAGLKDLTAIKLDFADALEHFSPPPQKLASKYVVIDDPDVIAKLRKDASATWPVGLDAGTFDGFDRVRLSRVRVWLEGAKPGSSSHVNVMVATAGTYLDRLDDIHYQFMSKPLARAFAYRVSATRKGTSDWEFDDGTYGSIEVDGVVDQEVSYAYFEPTPFAAWTISLTAHNPGLDLSGLTKVTMEFAGSVIPETAAAAARAPVLEAAR